MAPHPRPGHPWWPPGAPVGQSGCWPWRQGHLGGTAGGISVQQRGGGSRRSSPRPERAQVAGREAWQGPIPMPVPYPCLTPAASRALAETWQQEASPSHPLSVTSPSVCFPGPQSPALPPASLTFPSSLFSINKETQGCLSPCSPHFAHPPGPTPHYQLASTSVPRADQAIFASRPGLGPGCVSGYLKNTQPVISASSCSPSP